MKTAYLDCIGGISGDMALAALLDAGVDREQLLAGLRTLALPDWDLQVAGVRKSGIAATSAEVIVHGRAAGDAWMTRVPPDDAPLEGRRSEEGGAKGGHTHGRDERPHTHSHAGPSGHSHSHDNDSGHTHGHETDSQGRDRHAGTSTFDQVAEVIRSSGLPAEVKQRAESVYRKLAAAEAAVHGAALEQVHFHEVGAVDSIVDVVGAVYGLHLLGVEEVVCSPLPTGHGFVRCAHGMMPIPPPATAELLKGCPLRPVDVEGELVTPTGAALASALSQGFGSVPALTVERIGYGAGRKEFPFPNLLRVLIGTRADAGSEAAEVVLIEATIDDQSPQLFEGMMESLFEAGALDVWLTPVQMKKSRPGQLLSVLCEPGARETMSRILFTETTTLGVRYSPWRRTCLEREWLEVQTPHGRVRVKVGRQDGMVLNVMPEYADCRALARATGVPFKQIQVLAAAAAWQKLG